MENALVSAIVITYRQEQYIRQTLDSVFNQDYDNLEIIITDDNSPDNTFEIIKEYVSNYSGPHKVIINQNNPNRGIAGNVNRGLELSHGEVICLFDGDDIAYPDRVSKSVRLLHNKKVQGGTLNMEYIDKESNSMGFFVEPQKDLTKEYSIDNYLKGDFVSGGASRVFRRNVYTTFGDLNEDCKTEDTTYMFRTFLMGGAAFCYEPVVKYRKHDNNISNYHNLLTHFDPELIFNQYQKDLNIAFEKHLISEEVKQKIQKKIDDNKHNKVAIRSIYLCNVFLNRLMKAFSYLFKKGYTLYNVRTYVGLVRYWRKTNQ